MLGSFRIISRAVGATHSQKQYIVCFNSIRFNFTTFHKFYSNYIIKNTNKAMVKFCYLIWSIPSQSNCRSIFKKLNKIITDSLEYLINTIANATLCKDASRSIPNQVCQAQLNRPQRKLEFMRAALKLINHLTQYISQRCGDINVSHLREETAAWELWTGWPIILKWQILYSFNSGSLCHTRHGPPSHFIDHRHCANKHELPHFWLINLLLICPVEYNHAHGSFRKSDCSQHSSSFWIIALELYTKNNVSHVFIIFSENHLHYAWMFRKGSYKMNMRLLEYSVW